MKHSRKSETTQKMNKNYINGKFKKKFISVVASHFRQDLEKNLKPLHENA